jgi:2-oxoacid:acceptor oxidoreductase delta subunit (pyruvate/2-ketoisovalerate family)
VKATSKDFIPHLKCPLRTMNTGSWRLQRPVIEPGQCNLCLLCWIYCPEGAIRQSPSGLTVDLDCCKGCGICAHECRRGAVAMVEDEGGALDG